MKPRFRGEAINNWQIGQAIRRISDPACQLAPPLEQPSAPNVDHLPGGLQKSHHIDATKETWCGDHR